MRLAAFRLLCTYGATTAHRSERVWPLIDEAIRCYHGDAEFPAMLVSVLALVQGAATDEVKIAAADRMEFDADFAQGAVEAPRNEHRAGRSQAPQAQEAAPGVAAPSGSFHSRTITHAS